MYSNLQGQIAASYSLPSFRGYTSLEGALTSAYTSTNNANSNSSAQSASSLSSYSNLRFQPQSNSDGNSTNPFHSESSSHVHSEHTNYNSMLSTGYTHYEGQKHMQEQTHEHLQSFLPVFRPPVKVIKASSEVQKYIEETFEKLMGEELPPFKIFVLPVEEFMQAHARFGSAWSDGIMGFAVHATQEIYIREGPLDEIMVTAGHEIGHLMSQRLPDIVDEESKAMAFERAWAKTIVEHNIAGLKNNIKIPKAANNGIHNVAQHVVEQKLDYIGALDLFFHIAKTN